LYHQKEIRKKRQPKAVVSKAENGLLKLFGIHQFGKRTPQYKGQRMGINPLFSFYKCKGKKEFLQNVRHFTPKPRHQNLQKKRKKPKLKISQLIENQSVKAHFLK
jgi:hypothetical protein